MNQFNINDIRKQFPVLDQQVYGKPLVYFDNAATTQKPLCVIERERDYYLHENCNIHRGVHYLSQMATEAYENARKTVAQFVNARQPQEIASLDYASPNRHSYGVRELVRRIQTPSNPSMQWLNYGNGIEVTESGELFYSCPLTGCQNPMRCCNSLIWA